MKRVCTLLTFMLGSMLLLSSCSQGVDRDPVSYEQLESITPYMDIVVYDYQSIKAEAGMIAKVQVLDELSMENSTFLRTEDGSDRVYGFFSKREVRILEYYKNAPGYDNGIILGVLDKAAVSETAFWHGEGYEPLAKDGVYILYLSNETATRDWSIISAENGRVSLGKGIDQKGNWAESEFYEVKVKSLVEFASDLNQDTKELILNSTIQYPNAASHVGDPIPFSVSGADKSRSSLVISYGVVGSDGDTLAVDIRSIE